MTKFRNRTGAFLLGIWEKIQDELLLGLQLLTVIPVIILFIKEKASGVAWLFFLICVSGAIFMIVDLRDQPYYWIITLVLYLFFSAIVVTGELRALKFYRDNPHRKPDSIW